MSNILRPLPWSARRYSVSGIGEVITEDGEILKPSIKNGELFIKLNWIMGDREYLVALLVLVAYELVGLPDYLLDEVIPLYRDGSQTNLAPTNLLYKFKSGKLSVEQYPGFYYIPFYADYAINEIGELINIKSGKYKSWSITKPVPAKNQTGGYRYSRVINDAGFSKCLFQHRALCYVFKEYAHDVMELVVNHKDGKPENNSIENLELVTYQRNNIHAVEIGLRGDNKPILSRNVETGEILRFESILACGRYFGQPKAGFVQHRLRFGENKIYPDMLQFKFDDGTAWSEVDLKTMKINRVGQSLEIQARNVFTGDILIFEGTPEGERLTNVKSATILSHLREKKVIPVNGWNFRWLESNTIWPVHSEKHLQVYDKFPIYPSNGVIITDVTTGKETFFESVSLACQAFKISKHVLHHFAKTNKLLSGHKRFTIFDIRKI